MGQCQLTAASGPQHMLFSLCLVLPKCQLSKTPRAIFPSLALCFPLTLAFFLVSTGTETCHSPLYHQ